MDVWASSGRGRVCRDFVSADVIRVSVGAFVGYRHGERWGLTSSARFKPRSRQQRLVCGKDSDESLRSRVSLASDAREVIWEYCQRFLEGLEWCHHHAPRTPCCSVQCVQSVLDISNPPPHQYTHLSPCCHNKQGADDTTGSVCSDREEESDRSFMENGYRHEGCICASLTFGTGLSGGGVLFCICGFKQIVPCVTSLQAQTSDGSGWIDSNASVRLSPLFVAHQLSWVFNSFVLFHHSIADAVLRLFTNTEQWDVSKYSTLLGL